MTVPADVGPIERVVILDVQPSVQDGRYAVKRILGDVVQVRAHIIVDGHEQLGANLYVQYTQKGKHKQIFPMQEMGNDLWEGQFSALDLGSYHFFVRAWIDEVSSWWQGWQKKVQAQVWEPRDLQSGVQLLQKTLDQWRGKSQEKEHWELLLSLLAAVPIPDSSSHSSRAASVDPLVFLQQQFGKDIGLFIKKHAHHHLPVSSKQKYPVWVDRPIAGRGAWYEFFPRSAAAPATVPETASTTVPTTAPTTHGTFQDCARFLPYLQQMGFDILYLPPIHPIGRSERKGKNNLLQATANDPGSPWGIGESLGGHKSIHPQLGSLEDFRHFLTLAQQHGLEVALDVAWQCSPDHPYVEEHPEWFYKGPDGHIAYAENPPKKYQDIFPLNFSCDNHMELWQELKSVVDFWRQQGVRIFRVDNPHTKPFPFWRWLLEEIRSEDPGVIFLSEAFTRPHIMYYLAQIGFTQSYTYFTWRHSGEELRSYVAELTQTSLREFFRPNFWPNTPDILDRSLRLAPPASFGVRFVLAATLSSNYGIYGPAFEWGSNSPRDEVSEEYLNSEKYEIKSWRLQEAPLVPLITKVNQIRRQYAEVFSFASQMRLRFHDTDNEHLLCFSRSNEDFTQNILVVVNLDGLQSQSGWTELDLSFLFPQLSHPQKFMVEDLLQQKSYVWQGPRNYIFLQPEMAPAHIFLMREEREGAWKI